MHNLAASKQNLNSVALVANGPSIDSLPAEILFRIFEEVCLSHGSPDNWYCPNFLGQFVDSPALTLSWVSQYWRKLTFSNPALWSSIRLDADDMILRNSTPSDPPISDIIREFLRRSGDAPIRLSLSVVYSQSVDPQFCTILEVLVKESHRWRELQLATTWEALGFLQQHTTLDQIRGRLPILERLSVDWWDCFDIENVSPTLILFDHAPRLHDFTSAVIERPEDLQPSPEGCVRLPLEQIRSCTFRGSDLDEISYMASRTSQLEKLTIEKCRNEDIRNLAPRNVTQFNNITSLAVSPSAVWPTPHDWQSLSIVFGHLTLPNLHTLEIYDDASSEEWKWDVLLKDFQGFASRSRCRITDLCLRNLPLSNFDAVQSLIQLMPFIVKLFIQERDRTDQDGGQVRDTPAFLRAALNVPLSCDCLPSFSESTLAPGLPSPFLSNLENLELILNAGDGEWVSAIFSVLKLSPRISQSRGVVCLRSLSLAIMCNSDQDSASAARLLQEVEVLNLGRTDEMRLRVESFRDLGTAAGEAGL
ncbi:hypothetical protein K435DRAFT_789466 [Dendrothele bispora CBS 962.96]|uniref:F-box domain-containing protein n=1 Tax=Dendrothele bispora (strain CBS 962.96) TaxID=1314807 RepID=A0A4S8MTR7_DENBC|nr:hypothetical protein K435DRAFT_789466 [Dendrothele bispora CBS 962.96]